MIRFGNQIRLTPAEEDEFRFFTDAAKMPKTVEEHNAWLEDAARYWEVMAPGPEANLLAAIIRDQKA